MSHNVYISRHVAEIESISNKLKIDRLRSQSARKNKGGTLVFEKMVGDTGFEPVTSTVCKKHKKKGTRKI
jgi:hypothetical protein